MEIKQFTESQMNTENSNMVISQLLKKFYTENNMQKVT